MPASRPRIIVTGLPRSGTSWVAKTLSYLPEFTYYREPDNYDNVDGADERFEYLYLPAGSSDAGYDRHMRRALNGEIATPFTMQADLGPVLSRLGPRWSGRLGSRFPSLYIRKRGVLAKLVFGNLALEWLAESFPDASLVHIVRHPCGLFASWRRNGWEPKPKLLLGNDRLINDHLGPYAGIIESADSFWERAGALWGAYYTVIQTQLASHPDWVTMRHEWLCADPVANFTAVFERLGFAMPDAAAKFLTESDRDVNADEPFSLTRSSALEIDKWKRTLDADEIATCRSVVERFGIDLYPDFEPSTDPL